MCPTYWIGSKLPPNSPSFTRVGLPRACCAALQATVRRRRPARYRAHLQNRATPVPGLPPRAPRLRSPIAASTSWCRPGGDGRSRSSRSKAASLVFHRHQRVRSIVFCVCQVHQYGKRILQRSTWREPMTETRPGSSSRDQAGQIGDDEVYLSRVASRRPPAGAEAW